MRPDITTREEQPYRYRSAKAFFGRIGRSPEEAILQFIKSKCVPMLLYRLEVCPSDLKALDFVVDRFFTKLFQTINMEVIRLAQQCLILCRLVN